MGQPINAVFKGGGAKGTAYAGALRSCEELELEIRAAAGSSAGAITALLVACGFDAEEMAELLPDALRSLDSPGGAAFRFGRRSLLASSQLSRWLAARVADAVRKRTGEVVDGEDMTFGDLRDLTGVDLYVVAMDLGSRQPVVFSPDVTPSAPVVHAVVASSAIPVAFPAVRMAVDREVRRLVDGGVWANYPAFVFLDEDFRAAHGLVGSDRPVVGFVVDDREPVPPGTREFVPAPRRVIDTDVGSTARELGRFGALLASPLLHITMVLGPILAVLVMLQWVRTEARSAFPLFRPLPNPFDDAAALAVLLVVSSIGALGLVATLLMLRLGRALSDGGVGGAVAAMGVGPSVPYWAGAASRSGGGRHTVVRIAIPTELGTLSFRASNEVVDAAIRAGYDAAQRDLRRFGSSTGIRRGPPTLPPVRLPVGARSIAWFRRLPSLLRDRWRRRVESFGAKNPDWLRRRARLLPWLPGVGHAFGWVVVLAAAGTGIVTLVQSEARGDDRRVWLLLVFGPLALFASFLYSSQRARRAARPWTFLRRRSDAVLLIGGLGTIGLVAAAVVWDARTVGERPFSLLSVVENAHFVEAEVTEVIEVQEVSASRRRSEVEVRIPTDVPGDECSAAAGDRMSLTVPGLLSVGDPVQLTFYDDVCQVWPSSRVHDEVSDRVIGFLLTLAVLAVGVAQLGALNWRRRYRNDHGVEQIDPELWRTGSALRR